MKAAEFFYYFPHASKKYFAPNEDGDILYNKEDDVNEPAFWGNTNAVKKLGLSTSDFMTYIMGFDTFFATYKNLHRLTYKKQTWKPEEWSFSTSSPPAVKLVKNNINLENFRIYVNENDFFMLRDKFLDFSNITKIDFNDEKNQYCVALKTIYILSYLGGVSLKNLNSENNLAKSFAHFYFYYHLKKFQNYRKFNQYDTKPLEDLDWSLYNWQTHFVLYHSQIHYTPSSLKRNKHDVIKNIKREGKKVRYQTRLGKRDISKDYLHLIRQHSDGLTKTGQILFQESCQAYVYCVLGAQAKTRWKIIGDGANSFQTQKVFIDLVDEITTQDNLSILIKSMRLAIASTKVRLNFVISPGLDILPSDMVYIKDSPGYNNILLISNKNQKFGVNNVNSNLKPMEKENSISDEPEKQISESKNQLSIKHSPKSNEGNFPILVSAGLIAILGRIIWVAVL